MADQGLSAEEAGYLTDGSGRAAETVLARLIDTGRVRVSRDGLVSAVRQDDRGAITSIEARMLSQTRTAVRFGAVVMSATHSAEMTQLHRLLLDRGLMQRPRRRNDGWWFSLAVAGLLTLAGFVSPVFFAGVPIALGFFVWQYGRSPVTQAGKDALRHVTAHDRVHAVALYGLTGKVGGQSVGELFDLPPNVVQMVPPKAREERRRSSSDRGSRRSSSSYGCGSTSSSCGSGSDSSCGGSSGCGGGGGGD
ncbi:TIGR04222 domain-containing membrane protein [Lentzea cavernae]|uniref:TIGR04222 domain-containing protein n=1 Tax=Lentzea cavernae TaxID=2020703 RepID=A0ABQ3N5C8_9PSEU|nr:TIGR04222 domain-containing membrane protein [Lentzea cavernae]GHH63619.1 hypothetical protein GCM10017774_92990 [Lentzea cavernae]